MTSARRGRASVRPLASRIARFARERTVLLVSALAALATVAFVPPAEAYLGYFDVKTLACLFGILAVVGALRGIGLFEHAARLIVARFATCRSAVAALVGSTLVLSMFATNDLALIMMLPLSAATLLKAGWERSLPFAFIMQNLAANLGGMILPFGNPQNLYLYECFSIPLGDFLSVMTLPFAVSVALIALCCALFAKPEPPQPAKKRAAEKGAAEKGEMKERMQEERIRGKRSAVKGATGIRATEEGAAGKQVAGTRATENSLVDEGRQQVAFPASGEPLQRTDVSRETFGPFAVSSGSPRQTARNGEGPTSAFEQGRGADTAAPRIVSARRARALGYAALLVLVIASVFRVVPYPVAVGAVVAVLGVLDRRALRTVDWGLLLTFACFFVFAGNLARIPAVEGFFSFWMGESALLVAAGASQIISNVPAAVLLSHFADGYQALLVGVNIGGAGTLVASLASLITFNEYRLVRRGFPSRPALARVTPGAYLARFTAYNAAFLVVLLLVCAPFV